MKNDKQKGFSLIELLIVVAIILIIAAIAIPNLLKERMAASQASAVASIHTIDTAAITYESTYGNGFPATLAAIGTNPSVPVSCTNAELIDPTLTSGLKQGYKFAFTHGQVQMTTGTSSCGDALGYSDGFMVTAVPVSVGTTGQTSYCSDPTVVIRVNPAGALNPGPSPNCATSDAPLQ